MQKQLEYQNITLPYSLLLEDRKTISATVFPTQALLVKAPLDASRERIHEFLIRKIRWILKQQRYFAQFGICVEKRYVSGETFRYRGRCYKLLVRKEKYDEHISLQHGTLTVFSQSPRDREHTKHLLETWYTAKANKVLPERLAECVSLFEYAETPTLAVRKLNKRWGSYMHRTHKIILNQALVKAAKRHIDYVIIHELCHVTHKQHNRAFYELLEEKIPHWKKLKTELELSLLS